MVFIEVQYAEKDGLGEWRYVQGQYGRRIRVPMSEVRTLPRDGVLVMILSAETTENDRVGRKVKIGNAWF